MTKQMHDKVHEAESFLKEGNAAAKAEFLRYMDRWIGYFQHERLIHLLVTLFFALIAMLVLFAFVTMQNMILGLLFLIFFITDCFYINHYYLLENKTQYLYKLYDEITKMQ